MRKHRLSRAALVPPAVSSIGATSAAAVEALVTGSLLAAFDFEEYKGTGQKKDDEPASGPLELTLISGDADPKAMRAAVERGRAIADGQNFARTIASRPGNDINPPSLAKVAQEMAARGRPELPRARRKADGEAGHGRHPGRRRREQRTRRRA